MPTHLLEREQILPIGLNEAWAFFSAPGNLARITPPDMGFQVLDRSTLAAMHTGQRIRYNVRPLLGIPLQWETLITDVDEPVCFIDTQAKGPYALWRHEHRFQAMEGGVRMNDRVEYRLPMGVLGEWAHRTFVRRRLEHIFDFRHRALQEMFPVRS